MTFFYLDNKFVIIFFVLFLLFLGLFWIIWRKLTKEIKDDNLNPSNDIIRRNLFVEKVMVMGSWLFMEVSVYLMVAKAQDTYYFNPDKKPENWFDHIIEHFDVTGVIMGMIGILVGILIYFIVDNSDIQNNLLVRKNLDDLKTKNDDVKENLKSIKTKNEDVTKNLEVLKENNLSVSKNLELLKAYTEKIKSYISSLEMIKTVTDRFEKINSAITHAKRHTNDLYVLSYSLNYGQALIRNLKILDTEKSDDQTHKDKYLKLLASRNTNARALIDFSKSSKDRLHMEVLRSKTNDAYISQDKWRHLLEDKVLKNKNILIFDEHHEIALPEIKEYPNSFVLEVDNVLIHTSISNSEKLESLLEKLIEGDSYIANEIKKEKIISLDYVPFQFYVSVPEIENVNAEYYGIIIFTDYYNVGQENSTISFVTEQKELVLGLKNMYKNLKLSQENLDERLKGIKNIFITDALNKEIQFILKTEKGNPKNPASTNYYTVTPISDIKAKDDLESFFDTKNIPYKTNVLYCGDDSKKTFEKNLKDSSTYISIGLFYNVISEIVAGSDRCDIDVSNDFLVILKEKFYKGNGLFKFFSEIEGGKEKRFFKIATNTTKGQKINYTEPYYQTYFSKDPTKHLIVDYVLISRQKIKDSWIFVMGGIDFFGTEHLSECLSCKEFLDAALPLKPNQEFVAIFQLKKLNKNYKDFVNETKLLVYSYTDEIGNIKTKHTLNR